MRLSPRTLSALGGCAHYPSLHARTATLLESVQNPSDQEIFLARGITTCIGLEPYAEVPWLLSHQGDVRLHMVEIARPGLRTVVRGIPALENFLSLPLIVTRWPGSNR